MAAIKRASNVVWEGTIARGAGRLSAHSGAFGGVGRDGSLPLRGAGGQDEPGGTDRGRPRNVLHNGARVGPGA